MEKKDLGVRSPSLGWPWLKTHFTFAQILSAINEEIWRYCLIYSTYTVLAC